MKTSTFWMLALGLTLAIADLPADKPLGGGSLMKEAQAVVASAAAAARCRPR
jgi:hypothetical protein